MNQTSILALSSSRVGNSGYLQMAAPLIADFLGNRAQRIAFIPFAAVDNNYTAYLEKVKPAFAHLPYTIEVITPANAVDTLQAADAIMVGGGNTFHLLHQLYVHNLLPIVQQKVLSGTPYVGWSAGANITGLTIGTTNDMPVIEPKSFKALGFFPFQINPHYINQETANHNGETRDERLTEFLQVNPGLKIVGLPEGSALHLQNGQLQLRGSVAGLLFEMAVDKVVKKTPLLVGTNLSQLLQK